jgi:hypothetical protein
VWSGVIAHVVKDEELGFGAEVAGVGNAGIPQVGFGALGQRARVTRVGPQRARLDHVADQAERRGGAKGVHHGRCGVRHEQHVALVDLLKAADAGPIEAYARMEQILVEL